MNKTFFEVILAKGFDKKAINIFKTRKKYTFDRYFEIQVQQQYVN